MSNTDKKKADVVCLSSSDVCISRALYPQYSQQCLGEDVEHSSPPLFGETGKPPRTYQDTGIQTLPPPNGEVFELLHGRKPSHNECARSMGTAAIGRYTEDPRTNPYELMYGAKYTAPHPVKEVVYVDAGFQTATYDIRKMTLAKAKIKASMTANKYRQGARRAGYAVYAEAKDDKIIHSEQYPFRIQFDDEGNALDGTIEGCRLPNIYGRPVKPSQSVRGWRSGRPSPAMKHTPSLKQSESLSAPTHKALYPLSSQIAGQALPDDGPATLRQVSALAPSTQASDQYSGLEGEHEYAHVGYDTANLVVFDAGAAVESSPSMSIETYLSSSRKRRPSDDQDLKPPTKRTRHTAPETLPELPGFVTPSLGSPGLQPDRARKTTLVQSAAEKPRDSSDSLQDRTSRSFHAGQARALSMSNDYVSATADDQHWAMRRAHDRFSSLRPRKGVTSKSLKKSLPSQALTMYDNVQTQADAGTTHIETSSPTHTGGEMESSPRINRMIKQSETDFRRSETQRRHTRNHPSTSRKSSLNGSRQRASSNNNDKQSKSGFQSGRHEPEHLMKKVDSKIRSDACQSRLQTPKGENQEPIEKGSTFRASRTPRRALMPYVPPGKRVQAQQASDAEKE